MYVWTFLSDTWHETYRPHITIPHGETTPRVPREEAPLSITEGIFHIRISTPLYVTHTPAPTYNLIYSSAQFTQSYWMCSELDSPVVKGRKWHGKFAANYSLLCCVLNVVVIVSQIMLVLNNCDVTTLEVVLFRFSSINDAFVQMPNELIDMVNA